MLILVRHGETEANAGHLLQGRADLSLNARGRRQAAALPGVASGASQVVSSPLRRARETAAAMAPGQEIVVDERWIEIDYGALDGRPVGEAWVPLWEHWRTDPDYAPPGGESLADVGRRVRAACEELTKAASGADVVVVSHVSPIKAAVIWALGVGDQAAWRMFCDLASVTRLDIGERGPVLRSFNEVHHLAALDQG
ncbi:MAG: histidine phosphatase family protein [Actinomycetota bacterium]|nr:histidine phosphatase family protein [Actinomycetota bacterium]